MAGVDNYLATLGGLRSGWEMGIGTVEAGGARGSSFGLEVGAWVRVVGGKRAVASGLEEERLRLPVRGSGMRAVGCAISGLGFGLEEAGGGE